jgi:hypothetical protein
MLQLKKSLGVHQIRCGFNGHHMFGVVELWIYDAIFILYISQSYSDSNYLNEYMFLMLYASTGALDCGICINWAANRRNGYSTSQIVSEDYLRYGTMSRSNYRNSCLAWTHFNCRILHKHRGGCIRMWLAFENLRLLLLVWCDNVHLMWCAKRFG